MKLIQATVNITTMSLMTFCCDMVSVANDRRA